MNKKQKIILIVVASIVIASAVIWLIYGGEMFTKSQVLIEKKDPLFGFTEKTWINKFVWGLDLSLLISGVSIFCGGILFFIMRKRKSKL